MIMPTKANKTGFNKSTLFMLVISLCSTMERELLMLMEISAEIIVRIKEVSAHTVAKLVPEET